MKRREYRKSHFKQFFRDLPGSTRFAILTMAREPKTIPELLEEMEKGLKEAVDKGFVVIEGQRSGYSVYTLLEEGKAAAEFHCDISVKAFPSQII